MDNKLKIVPLGERAIEMSREFDAPRSLLFDALTNLALLKRWFGLFGGWALSICEIDLRVGGAFHFVWKNIDGQVMGMRGVYREIVVPERIVNTETYEGQLSEWLTTSVLIEHNGRTKLTSTIQYESMEFRDAVLSSGMGGGAAASYDKLDEVLDSMQKDSG